MIVYLDSAQYDLIERASRDDRDSVDALLSVFETHGCVLALTEVHLFEMAPGSGNPAPYVLSRFEAVLRFPKLVRETLAPDELVLREVSIQLRQLLASNASSDAPTSYAQVRAALWKPADGRTALMERIRLAQRIRQDRGFENDRAAVMNELRSRPTYRRARTERVGAEVVRAEAARYGITGWRSLKRAPLADFGMLSYWGRRLDRPLVALFRSEGVAPEVVRSAIPKIEWYELPAWSYAVAMTRGLDTGEKRFEAGDAYDTQHVPYMAYADVAFSDKRVVDWIDRTRRDRPNLLSGHVSPAIQKATSVKAIIDAIEAKARGMDQP